MDQGARLRLVADEAGLSLDGDVVLLDSHSNDAWKVGDAAVRICWRGDRLRLLREAAVLRGLPESVPHVDLLDAGLVELPDGALSWTATRWVESQTLVTAWPTLSDPQRDSAARQLGSALEALHQWQPAPEIAQALTHRPPADTPEFVTGADLNPLPVDRALTLIESARRAPQTDPALIDALAQRLDELRSVDPFQDSSGVVVHGDAHLGNVLWHANGAIAALVDLEWARLGPCDLELQPLLRPEPGHPADLLARLGGAYPALIGHPQIVQRLWLYDLAFTLRHLLVWPATGEVQSLPDFHPLRRLPIILESPQYLERILDDAA